MAEGITEEPPADQAFSLGTAGFFGGVNVSVQSCEFAFELCVWMWVGVNDWSGPPGGWRELSHAAAMA